jgi:hypothetical protein
MSHAHSYTRTRIHTRSHTHTTFEYTVYKNINVIIKITGEEKYKKKNDGKSSARIYKHEQFEINEDNGFLTGVPKIFVVRLMGQVSQLIAGGGKRRGEEKGRVLPVYNLLFESKSGPPRGQGVKNIFPSFRTSLRAKLIVASLNRLSHCRLITAMIPLRKDDADNFATGLRLA